MIPVRQSTKFCVVCKAPASFQNFGVITCEACKSFFRRAFIKDIYRSYRCINGGNCMVSSDDRKSCSSCRFQSCLNAGMETRKTKNHQGNNSLQVTKVASRTAARDCEMEVAAQELMQELLSLTSCYVPNVNDKGKFFSMMEIFDLDTLTSKYSQSFYNIPLGQQGPTPFEQMVGIILSLLNRLIFFANSITEFKQLDFSDREILFRGACSQLCMINTVLTFDKDRGVWIAPISNTNKFYKTVPVVTCQQMVDVLGQGLHKERVNITIALQTYQPDETVIMLLYAILLFTPSRSSLSNVKAVQKSQMHFANLLRKYLRWRCGEKEGDEVFLCTLQCLKGFRKIGPYVFDKIHRPYLEGSTSQFTNNV